MLSKEQIQELLSQYNITEIQAEELRQSLIFFVNAYIDDFESRGDTLNTYEKD